MINCWINESTDLSRGEVIEIREGVEENSDDRRIRVMRFYSYSRDSDISSWDRNVMMIHPRQTFQPPIYGMVSGVRRIQNRTEFILREVRRGLPPFNLNGQPLTNTFISSRIEEVMDERLQARNGVSEANSRPIYWESFLPESRPAREAMIEHLNNCHIYVGIFASEYSEPTVNEYRRARELGIPILCFVKNVERREPQLGELIREFQDGEIGITYNSFDTPRELFFMVRDYIPIAINDLFE